MSCKQKTKLKLHKCKNCNGEVIYDRGWRHVVATGCVNPAVDLNSWKQYLKEKRGEVGVGR